MKNANALNNFINFYENFNLKDKAVFDEIYDQSIFFADPFHKVNGNTNLFVYFSKLMKKVSTCRFSIEDIIQNSPEKPSAILSWKMFFCHPKLNGGKEIVVEGVTHLKFGQKVTYQRDYFDSSQLIYHHIPIIGFVIKFIERRI
ncbi:MAG: nuclear transport factor 2 family protein [Bdellovibrionaceae bacterium]|nr:nuclear transport factor 2 family protein [Pseudobdellovibrionaceae bacterium]